MYVQVPGQPKTALKGMIVGEPGQLTESEESEPLDVLAERFRKRLGSLAVEQFRTRHPEVIRVLKNAERVNARNTSSIWQPILVGPKEERRLRFINALLQTAEQFGSGGYLRCSHEHIEVYLAFGGVAASMDVRYRDRAERALEIRMQRYGYGTGPSGWEDETGSPLEHRFVEIIVEIARFGVIVRRELDEQTREQAKREAAKLAEISRKARAAEDAARQKAIRDAKERAISLLLSAAEGRQKALAIRTLVTELSHTKGLPAEDLAVWRVWALAQADTVDPLLNGDMTRLVHVALEAAKDDASSGEN